MNNKYNNILTPVNFVHDDSWQTLPVITARNVYQHISQPMANTGAAS